MGDHPPPSALKRYLVFAFDDYYPTGGWNDFIESFDTLDYAALTAERVGKTRQVTQVVDSTTLTVVWPTPQQAG